MTDRIWHKGPPPHVGWWNASVGRVSGVWRWWNGEYWSMHATSRAKAIDAAQQAAQKSINGQEKIEWSDYYPENARVPRVDPKVIDVEKSRSDQFAESQVLARAMRLLEVADQYGVNVTISRSVKPLAPRESVYAVDVWQKRS